MQFMSESNILRRFRVTIVAVEKYLLLMSIPECVPVALDIQHANHMRRTIFISVARLVVPFFPRIIL